MSFFLALEGADGSGTTTQTKLVAAKLRALGYSVHETHEPSTGPIGTHIRTLLGPSSPPVTPQTIALLFAADRLDHLRHEVEPSLARGDVCITDRYALSSFAYQAIDCDLAWVRALNSQARAPDLYILLDIDAEVGASRRRLRGGPEERFDADSTQHQVIRNYRALARTVNAISVDGHAPPEQVTETILQHCFARGL